MQGKNLSKKDKIQLFDSFTSALQSRQDLIIDEIERILKHANKSGDRKYKDFSDLDILCLHFDLLLVYSLVFLFVLQVLVCF